MITRLYTGDDGQSHFEELDMDIGPYPWGELKDATGVMFRHDEPGKFIDWHVAPRRQFIITLSGEVEIGASDGSKRVLRAGDVRLMEDVAGKGHSHHDLSPSAAVYILLDD